MKQLRRYAITFLLLIAGYLLFALMSSLLPNKAIAHHVAKTVERADLVTDFGFMLHCTPPYYMDNFTDALILNQALSGGTDSLLTNMLLVPRAYGGGEECASLRQLVEDDSNLRTLHYGRYWHGSTFLMRFLLLIGDYTMLRMLFYLVTSLLLLWTSAALWRRRSPAIAAAFLTSLLLVNLFIMQFSIQFAPVLVIALCATLWVLYRVKDGRQLCFVLFVTGSLTSYFDLLTCPMLTWGLPLTVWLLRPTSIRQGMRDWGHASALWASGYGITWVSKWFIATALTTENVVRDGLSQFSIRAGTGEAISRFDALTRNIGTLNWPIVCIAILIVAVVAFLMLKRRPSLPALRTSLLPLLLTAAATLVWYLVLADHSYLHYWFTYRDLAVTLFALLAMLSILISDCKR